VSQEGSDYGMESLAQQGLSEFSTNAYIFVFQNAHGMFFSLKVVVNVRPHHQAFDSVLCDLEERELRSTLIGTQFLGRQLPTGFRLESDKRVFVLARYSVGKTGLRQLQLHIHVKDQDPFRGIFS